MKALRQILVSFGLVGYIFLAVFGLLAMSYVHHHSMAGVVNCPYMIGEQALCTMDFTEHIGMWQNLTNVTQVTLLVVTLPTIIIFFLLFLHPPDLARSRLYARPLRENYITILFSQGILNPKLH